MSFRLLATVAIVVAFTAPTLAHHSLSNYDQNTIVTIKGTIGEIKWLNPHAVIVVQVKNSDGSSRSIQVEMAPPNGLVRKGIDPALFKIGDAVTVDVWMPKALGRNSDYSTGRTLTLADGRQFDVGDSLMWSPVNVTAPNPVR